MTTRKPISAHELVQPHTGAGTRPLDEQPAFRPRGTTLELHGGAVGIDHALQVWDIGSCGKGVAFRVDEMSEQDRRAIGDYMVQLWSDFRNWRPAVDKS